jgi:hypothetical protein
MTESSHEENDPGSIFIGMVHSGSQSLHTILEESFDEGDATSGRGGVLGSSALEGAMW